MSDHPLIVVVDDERIFDANTPVVYLRNSSQALGYLARTLLNQQSRFGEVIDELWLDHDLGKVEGYPEGKIDTTLPVAGFLNLLAVKGLKIEINTIWIHSQNSSGSDYILPLLSPHYNVRRVPLPELERA